ncbi:MAG: cysteine peptidase family C39 domain-containing protein [Bacilli bacterium]|jgi:predicted double-glycine peptidase
MRYFAFQGNDYDCGFASLKMLLCYAHKTPRYLRLAKPDHKGGRYTYRDLLEIALDNGVVLTAYKLIEKDEISYLKKLPVLVSLKNPRQSLHLIVLRNLRRNKVLIDDPRLGAVVLSLADFLKRWDGSFIQITSVAKKSQFKKERPILDVKNRLALMALQTFSALFALLGFAFVSQQSYFAFPLLFFALFMICELFFRRFQLRILEQFDHRYLMRTYDEDKNAMRRKFTSFFDFKKHYFLFPQTLISAIIISFFAILILLLNDLLHALFLAAIILCAFIDFLLYKNIDRKNARYLESLEGETLTREMSKRDAVVNYEQMSRLAHFIAKSATARRYVGFFLIGVLSLTYAAMSKEATLNYFLFHFFIYLLFFENVGKLFATIFDLDDLKKKSAAFKDQFVR